MGDIKGYINVQIIGYLACVSYGGSSTGPVIDNLENENMHTATYFHLLIILASGLFL